MATWTKSIILFSFFLLITHFVLAQKDEMEEKAIEAKEGGKNALKKMIQLSSSKMAIGSTNNGRKALTLADVAYFHLLTLTTFTNNELPVKILVDKNKFKGFIQKHIKKLEYFEDMKYWGMSPLQDRQIKYNTIKKKYDGKLPIELPDPSKFIYINKPAIDSLWEKKSPQLFSELAKSIFTFKENNQYYLAIEFIEAITDMIIRIENKEGKLVGVFDSNDYYHVQLANYVAFWLQNYQYFRWNSSAQKFNYVE